MIFWPEHAEDTSSFYWLNYMLETISDLQISKRIMTPTYIIVCVCISSCTIGKEIVHCCFYILRGKKAHPA